MHRRYGLTRLLALAAMALVPAWGSAALLTIGPDDGFVPRVLTQLPTSAPISGTALSTLGDGSVGFNGGLASDGSGLFAIGNDSSGASSLYSMTAGGGSMTPVGSGLGSGFYGGLAYRATGSGGDLFAIASDSSAASTLYKVTGGSATAVGSGLGFGFYGGLTYNADDGLLYAIAGDTFGVQRVLMSIDAVTGVATTAFNLGDGTIGFNGGLAYDADADRFFVIGNDSLANSSLYSFTLSGPGSVSAIGSSFGQGFLNASLVLLPDGGTPVPEPSTLMLLSGLLWLGRCPRRGPRR